MHEITLRGTPAEMGATHGDMMRGLLTLAWDSRFDDLAKGCEAQMRVHAPDYVDEMEAFAEAAQLDPARLKAFTLCAPLQQTIPSCSVVAVLPEHSANGKLMVGRNYDYDFGISLEGATTYHTYPKRGLAHVGNSDIWVGREDGLNEAGLFVAMSATFLPGVQPGLTFWFVVRHMLEHCRSVEEASAWIAKIPHAQSRNYMLADHNTAVVVEATIEGVHVRGAENGLLAMTNHPAHPDWVLRNAPEPDDSQMRYSRLRTLAPIGNAASTITEQAISETLNDRPSGLCAYAEWDNATYGTIWSVVACPEEMRFEVAPGAGASGTMRHRDVAADLREYIRQPA